MNNNGLPHQNGGAAVGGGGAHQIGPVLHGVFGIFDALALLNDATASIRVAANSIGQVPEVTTLAPALRDVLTSIRQDSGLVIRASSVVIFTEVQADPHLVMFPAEIRTIQLSARMASSSVMRLHSLLQFNSNLRVDGHGPRFRIHRGLARQHLALSAMQRFLDLLFSLEHPGYVYPEE